MIRRPPRSTLFPYTSSSDLGHPHRALLPLGGRGRRRGLPRRPLRAHPSRHAPRRRGTHRQLRGGQGDRKSTRLNSSHLVISYAVFCLKKKKKSNTTPSRIS